MQSNASFSHAWPRPPSPTFSTTTTGSKVNLSESHTLISRKDLRASIACFEDLMAAAKAYRNALLAMSSATAAFASAMEACSRVKGCREANAALAGAGGLQFLISNHEQLLADTVYRQFEIPLLEALDNYKLMTSDRLAQYEKALQAQSEKIRRTEAENMKIGRRKKRDLSQFRTALAELQRQVDELDGIKLQYHEEVLEAEEETWDTVLSKVAFVIRSQLDFYEKIAGKASDPILEPIVSSIPDPFDALRLDSAPASPTPNLTRILNSQSNSIHSSTESSPDKAEHQHSVNKEDPRSPSKLGLGSSAPASAQPCIVDAMGERGVWDDVASGLRARRELSVIDERESVSPSKSGEPLASATDDEANGEAEHETESEAQSQGPTNDVNEAKEDSDGTHTPKTPKTPSTPTPHTPKTTSDTLDNVSTRSTRSRVSETAPQVDVAA
ncbi:hypothetical protein A1Q1_05533 [Trichosporon asahii var. asahii CBS 2479]|nr:hypothetical protein A1Q1_05533 [Trichosporon asahii var. asahii CBS 2479]EJT45987.1 hypothetical protein A1Q1_05533 [Trichosporon asahii var. asahii CBS 2479]